MTWCEIYACMAWPRRFSDRVLCVITLFLITNRITSATEAFDA